ncbi:polysaccharide biosynthesis protein [Neisseria gonorrhoeae]|nr:polysaccharide biosynthesis protein [Neisseria gonorrhoeae]CFC28845.1 pilin glycosylation protein [Neisseria gonorrhoeae]CFR91199.1 pilin glycosylation protein [Neisseria gonorrhoeae]CNP58563.1 pilin glycosylation protein [Neisseria gonorrhoeae]
MDTKEILGYAAGSIGSAVLAVIILPLLSWYFPADDIGRIVLMQTAAGLTVSVLCLGLDQAYVREYYAAADKDTLFKTLFLPPLLFSAAIAALLLSRPSLPSEILFSLDDAAAGIGLVLFELSFLPIRFLLLVLRMEGRALAFSSAQLVPKLAILLLLPLTVGLLHFPANTAVLTTVYALANLAAAAFVDDNPKLWHTVIYDLAVYQPDAIAFLIERYGVEKILLAIPSATQEQRRRIISKLKAYPCEVLTIPGMKDLMDGKISIGTLKKISVSDLLGRDSVAPDDRLMNADTEGKTVMVTGAGGSIGSELCRQIIRRRPERLLLFELSEFALYTVEKELCEYCARNGIAAEILPFLGSVQNRTLLTHIMTAFSVATVYHAAAYKHVPMVEFNTVEGIRNNIFGTLECALAATASGVETFVLISTDKAVRPANTMGAGKRMAELCLQALAAEPGQKTRFSMVRFGNVLGSSGSVVPLFEKQIAEGGPITLTHPDITRYFMTIPEAAQLVIQAGAMGRGGDVFVLDMGESVKITDLARQMITLSGLKPKTPEQPDGDIEILITGLRPGEKLYEELLIGDNVRKTGHPRIMTADETMLPWHELSALLDRIRTACDRYDQQAIRDLLVNAPTGFTPTGGICDLLWVCETHRKNAV